MESAAAVRMLSAMMQEHRLAAFRLLIRAGRAGLPAGAIVERLGIAPSSGSFHLARLVNAVPARQDRQGRLMRYAPDHQAVAGLVD